MPKNQKLILTSYGLTNKTGRALIKQELGKDGNLKEKRIFIFCEPFYAIEPMEVETCMWIGFKKENTILSTTPPPKADLLTVDYFYVTGGNTLEVMSLLREHGLDEVICQAFANDGVLVLQQE